MSGRGGVRVGDAERRAVDAQLQAAVGAGVLTLAEYEERTGAVWAARTRGDLAALVDDLPPPPVAVAAAADRPRARRPLRWALAAGGVALLGWLLVVPVRTEVVHLGPGQTVTVELPPPDLPPPDLPPPPPVPGAPAPAPVAPQVPPPG